MGLLLLWIAIATGLRSRRLLKKSPSAPSSRPPTDLPSSTISGATSACSRASSYMADNSPIVTTTVVWYCGDHNGTARPLMCGLQMPQAVT